MSYLTIRYSCKQCGLHDVEVSVPAREFKAYDVRDWMRDVVHCIADSHRTLRPWCLAKEVTEVKIPLGGDWIGHPNSKPPPTPQAPGN
jgi:hypothetical protein